MLSVDEEREASQHRAFRGAEVRGMCWFFIGKQGMNMDMGTAILLGLHRGYDGHPFLRSLLATSKVGSNAGGYRV